MDFASHGGHKFLFDYLLYLERKGDDDAKEAVRNMVFLISGLVTAGFHPGNISLSLCLLHDKVLKYIRMTCRSLSASASIS